MATCTKMIVSAEAKRGHFSNQNGLSVMATFELDSFDDPMEVLEGWHDAFSAYLDRALEQWSPPVADVPARGNGGGRY